MKPVGGRGIFIRQPTLPAYIALPPRLKKVWMYVSQAALAHRVPLQIGLCSCVFPKVVFLDLK